MDGLKYQVVDVRFGSQAHPTTYREYYWTIIETRSQSRGMPLSDGEDAVFPKGGKDALLSLPLVGQLTNIFLYLNDSVPDQ